MAQNSRPEGLVREEVDSSILGIPETPRHAYINRSKRVPQSNPQLHIGVWRRRDITNPMELRVCRLAQVEARRTESALKKGEGSEKRRQKEAERIGKE